jgi:hypothetical protein
LKGLKSLSAHGHSDNPDESPFPMHKTPDLPPNFIIGISEDDVESTSRHPNPHFEKLHSLTENENPREIKNMIQNVVNNINGIAFGGHSDRFKTGSRFNSEPGPGSYNLTSSDPPFPQSHYFNTYNRSAAPTAGYRPAPLGSANPPFPISDGSATAQPSLAGPAYHNPRKQQYFKNNAFNQTANLTSMINPVHAVNAGYSGGAPSAPFVSSAQAAVFTSRLGGQLKARGNFAGRERFKKGELFDGNKVKNTTAPGEYYQGSSFIKNSFNVTLPNNILIKRREELLRDKIAKNLNPS